MIGAGRLCDTRRMSAHLIGSLAVFLYFSACAVLLAQRRHGEAVSHWPLALAALAAVAHLGVHGLVWQQRGGTDLHFFAALSLVGLGMAALTVSTAFSQRLEALGVVVYPIAALTLTGHLLSAPGPVSTLDWPLQLHAWLAILAYASLAIATLMAGMLWFQERALRRRDVHGWWRALPPLTQLEALLFRTLAASFALLSVALLTGVVFVADLFAQHLIHKTVLSLLSWAVLAMLLFGRWRWGWRGPRAVTLTLTAMALLLLAFFGSKFVLEIILQRS